MESNEKLAKDIHQGDLLIVPGEKIDEEACGLICEIEVKSIEIADDGRIGITDHHSNNTFYWEPNEIVTFQKE